MHKWVRFLLQLRSKRTRHWDETMGQCSVLVLEPRATLPALLRRLLCLPDQKRKVKVPAPVKVCIFDVLRSIHSNGHQLRNGAASLRRSRIGERFLWACNSGSGTAEVMLTWHIATCILEVRHPYRLDTTGQGSPLISDQAHQIAATHLSRYCAYLMAWSPELLPDEDAWSKSLYKAVKEDAVRG
jgi:streptomycin 6-kinase